LLDKKYQDIGNIQQAGRWIRAGVNISLNLEKKMKKQGNDVIEIVK
jgi:hypothetical protein